MIKSLTVFLCSTQADLGPEREAVLAAVRRLQLQHDSMEFFGARENAPLETCLAEVRRSDILVVVIGHRYGTFVQGQEISYTEAEYREGYRLGKPCLVYMRNEEIPILPRFVERNPAGMEALARLKGLLQERHTVASFREANDLAVGVAADLSRTVQALEESARIEAEQAPRPVVSLSQQLTNITTSALEKGIGEAVLLDEIRHAVSRLLSAEGNRQPTVFLSYTTSDKNIVRTFASAMRSKGLAPWIDEEQITAGQSLLENVSRGLQSADCLAIFMSKSSMRSQWVGQELNMVMASRLSSRGRGPIILPVLLEDMDVPAVLRDVKYVDLRDGNIERAVQECSLAIKRHLDPASPHLPSPTNFHTLEKSIHALRALLHARLVSPEENKEGTGRRSLEHAIEDLAKAVGGLCGLTTRPNNRLQDFVNNVVAAQEGDDLPKIFRSMPELRQYLAIPYFDTADINDRE